MILVHLRSATSVTKQETSLDASNAPAGEASTMKAIALEMRITRRFQGPTKPFTTNIV